MSTTERRRTSARRDSLLGDEAGAFASARFVRITPMKARRVVDMVRGLPVDDALALLHATFWDRLDLADHPVSRPLVSTMPGTFVNVMRARNVPLAEQRWADWLTPQDLALFEHAGDRFVEDLATLNRPMTFVHGDPRSDNILFDGGAPVLLDWAQPGVAHPGFDVGYLLGSSLRVEERDDIAPLVERYRSRLADAGVELDTVALEEGIGATARAMIVQQLNSLTVLIGDYGEHGLPADLWVPRLLAVAHTYTR